MIIKGGLINRAMSTRPQSEMDGNNLAQTVTFFITNVYGYIKDLQVVELSSCRYIFIKMMF